MDLFYQNQIFCVEAGDRSHQIFFHVIKRLQESYLQNNVPSLGRVFWITALGVKVLQTDETYNTFSFLN